MKIKTQHPHAEMIAEWIKDTSRVVEQFDEGSEIWELDRNPAWYPETSYRFAGTVKPKIVSSLRDDVLEEIFGIGTITGGVRRVANAAAQRAIEELEVPDKWVERQYKEKWYSAGGVLRAYLRDLKKGRL